MKQTTITQIELTPNQLQILVTSAVEQALSANNKPTGQAPTFSKIPVQEIFAKKMLSKPTFYSHVKSGKITLYKMGGRSYVDGAEFNQAFKKVEIAKENQ